MADGWLKFRVRTFLFLKGVVQRMTLGARMAVIVDGKVLLLKHTYMPGWQMPGGGIDPGETAEQAARRECVEETGFEPLGDVKLFAFYHNTKATNRDHVALFVATSAREVRTFKPNHEIRAVGWFPVDDLPEDVLASTRQRIAEIRGDHPPAANW